MRRATTPTYIFTFPFAVSQLDDLTITFKQGSRSIVKHKEDGDIEDVKFSFTLTQQETKTFCEGNCKGQVKLLAGSRVLGSTIFDVKVRPILDDTVWNIPDGETEEEQTTETVVVAPIAPTGEILIDEYEQSFEVTFTETYVMGGGGSASDISVDDSSIYWSAEVDNAQEALDLLAEDTYNAGQEARTAKALIKDHTTDISVAQSDYSSGKYHVKDAERTAWNGKYTLPQTGIPKSDLADGVQTSLGKADSAYQLPSGGIPKTDLASGVQGTLDAVAGKYEKPSGGIPKSDLASGVQSSLDKADTAVQSSDLADYATKQELTTGLSSKYEKPSGGIPSTDMTQAVRTSLGKADSAIQSSDLADALSDYVSDTDLLEMIDTSIDSSSTDSEIASAKAVYTAIQSAVSASILTALNTPV